LFAEDQIIKIGRRGGIFIFLQKKKRKSGVSIQMLAPPWRELI
jgi:hypothetical protein